MRWLADDVERADGGGAVQVHAAAEFLAHKAVRRDAHHAHGVFVLLAEQRHGSTGHRFGMGLPVEFDRCIGQHRGPHHLFDLIPFLGGHCPLQREVEPKAIRRHQGSGLVDRFAQDRPQGGVQKVGGGVVAFDAPAARLIYFAHGGIPDRRAAPTHRAPVDQQSRHGPLDVVHGDFPGRVVA